MTIYLRAPFCYRALIQRSSRPISLLPYAQFQSQSSIRHRTLATASADSSSAPEASVFPSSLESETSSAPTRTTPEFEPLTYHVHRTPGQQLPIYHLAKAGGNKHLTRIRKISGSIEDLKNDLRKALALGEKDIVINNVNGHIVIKGWKKFEVAKFLEEKHF